VEIHLLYVNTNSSRMKALRMREILSKCFEERCHLCCNFHYGICGWNTTGVVCGLW